MVLNRFVSFSPSFPQHLTYLSMFSYLVADEHSTKGKRKKRKMYHLLESKSRAVDSDSIWRDLVDDSFKKDESDQIKSNERRSTTSEEGYMDNVFEFEGKLTRTNKRHLSITELFRSWWDSDGTLPSCRERCPTTPPSTFPKRSRTSLALSSRQSPSDSRRCFHCYESPFLLNLFLSQRTIPVSNFEQLQNNN